MKTKLETEISLHGAWRCELDRERIGRRSGWQERTLKGKAELPGTTDSNKLGYPPADRGLKDMTPRHEFIGAAWFQREIEVPSDAAGKRITLFLERCQWETWAWLDGKPLGTRDSLVGPHRYDLTGTTPGRHVLTLCIDNANRKDVGATGERIDGTKNYDLKTEIRQETRLNCGGHHMWAHNWCGAIGSITLQIRDAVHLENVHWYPDTKNGRVRVRALVANHTGAKSECEFIIRIARKDVADQKREIKSRQKLDGSPRQFMETTVEMPAPWFVWDDITPVLYNGTVEMQIDLNGDICRDIRTATFGMRTISTCDQKLLLNGRQIFLRGCIEESIFPLTGHPPMDVEEWKRILGIAKEYGLNHMRFHCNCPPDAAFTAADELGFLFQVEAPGTSCPDKPESAEVDAFLTVECERMLDEYGNHPSFCLMSMGNEQLYQHGWDAEERETYRDFLASHTAMLVRRVEKCRALDSRHLYTCTSHPWSPGRKDDYYVSAWGDKGRKDSTIIGIAWGGGDVLHTSRFNVHPSETASDVRHHLTGIDKPVIAHEVGQWQTYPDVDEIPRFTGILEPLNYQKIRDDLVQKGLISQLRDFVAASGALVVLLYKEEIESLMRSSGVGGFQLLELRDFPGQGTSPVGILTSLWESKGLIESKEWRRFCSRTVPLLRLCKRVWERQEVLHAKLECTNYSTSAIRNAPVLWRLEVNGKVQQNGQSGIVTLEPGQLTDCGGLTMPLIDLPAPCKATIIVEIPDAGAINSWDVWIYPDDVRVESKSVMILPEWNEEAKTALRDGKNVMILASPERLPGAVPGCFTPIFWNPVMKHAQISKTMGLLIKSEHPALKEFPTEIHSDWQWWDLAIHSRAFRCEALGVGAQPIVQVIDGFSTNRRLGMILEAKVGTGRLIICSVDLETNLSSRPVARQMRNCLMKYLSGGSFKGAEISAEALDRFWKENQTIAG